MPFLSVEEKKLLEVYRAYGELLSFKATDAPAQMNKQYNTFKNNVAGKHDPKVGLLMRITHTLFPENGKEIFPDFPPDVSNSLTESEMNARCFAAWLGDDEKKMHEVADYLHRLADKKLSSLPDLLALKAEYEASREKKKAKKKDK